MEKSENIKYFEFVQVVQKLTESSGLSKFVMSDVLKNISDNLKSSAMKELEEDIERYNAERQREEKQKEMEKLAEEDLKKRTEVKPANTRSGGEKK